MHDGRGQNGVSFEYDAIFGKNLNPEIIRGLSRDSAHLGFFFNRNLSILQFFIRYFGVNQLSELTDHF